jgi:ribosomal protein S18 acetylase RimI-like enzyme
MIEKNSAIRKNGRLLFADNPTSKKINKQEALIPKKYIKKIRHDREDLESITIEKDLKREKIYIFQNTSLNFLRSLKISGHMGNFFKNFKNPASETKKMLENLTKENIVSIAYNKENEIIGYLTMVKPEEKKFNFDKVYQIGAIEVNKDYRKLGIAMELMKLFEDNFFDDKIVYTFCYSWHWDITECNKKEYREKVLHLLHSQKFSEEFIDDINIKMDPYNVFAVRCGKKADAYLIKKFKRKLFKEDFS